MNTNTMNTAKELCVWAVGGIDRLAERSRYNSLRAVYAHLSELSGVSHSLIQQFHNGKKPNPSAITLDRIVEAIKVAQRLSDERAA